MAQSLARTYLHVVFSTKKRKKLILNEYERGLYAYICATCKNINCPVHEINGIEDHIHILLELSRTITIAKLLETIKSNSSRWMKKQFPNCQNFQWQNGYGVFSVGYLALNPVRNYIKKQKLHHKRQNFKQEFIGLLDRAGVDYDENNVWD